MVQMIINANPARILKYFIIINVCLIVQLIITKQRATVMSVPPNARPVIRFMAAQNAIQVYFSLTMIVSVPVP